MCSFDFCCCCAGFNVSCCGGCRAASSRSLDTNTDQPVKHEPKRQPMLNKDDCNDVK